MGHDNDKWGYLGSRKVTCVRNMRELVPVLLSRHICRKPVPKSRNLEGYRNKTTARVLAASFIIHAV